MRDVVQPQLVAAPPMCRGCKVETDPRKIRDGRCVDVDACHARDRERFARAFGDNPCLMAAYDRGTRRASDFLAGRETAS